MFLKLNFQDCCRYYLIMRYSLELVGLEHQQSNQGIANRRPLELFLASLFILVVSMEAGCAPQKGPIRNTELLG